MIFLLKTSPHNESFILDYGYAITLEELNDIAAQYIYEIYALKKNDLSFRATSGDKLIVRPILDDSFREIVFHIVQINKQIDKHAID